MDQIVLGSLPTGKLTISLDAIYENIPNPRGTLEGREGNEEYQLSPEEAEALDW